MKKSIFTIISAFSLLFTACQDVVKFQVDSLDPRLVIEGHFSQDSSQNIIHITYNQGFYDSTAAKPATGLEVKLFDNNGLQETLNEVKPGWYKSNTSGKIGTSYWLQVKEINGKTFVSAPQLLQATPDFNYFSQWEVTLSNRPIPFLTPGTYVTFGFTEPAATRDFYWFKIYVNDSLKNDLRNFACFEDKFFNGATVDSQYFPLSFDQGDRVKVVHQAISESQYLYLNQLSSQLGSAGSPFDVPSAPLRGNLKNKDNAEDYCLGWFGVGYVKADSIVIR